jgi:hypothetical protein
MQQRDTTSVEPWADALDWRVALHRRRQHLENERRRLMAELDADYVRRSFRRSWSRDVRSLRHGLPPDAGGRRPVTPNPDAHRDSVMATRAHLDDTETANPISDQVLRSMWTAR